MSDETRHGGGESVAAYYDRMAPRWDDEHGVNRLNPHFARRLRRNLHDLLASEAGRATALELGAGTGPYVDVVAPLFKTLIASDLSRGMLDECALRLGRLGIANVRLSRMDACDLGDVASGSVDVVYSIGLLETVPDLDRLFAETSRVLAPGGLAAGITSNGDCPWYRIRPILEGGERHGRTRRYATAAGLRSILTRAGLGPPEVVHWGAVPPGMRNSLICACLAMMERIVEPTPLARFLGVMSFRSRKPPVLP